MDTTSTIPIEQNIRSILPRWQSSLSLLFLAAIMLTYVVISLLAHSKPIENISLTLQTNQWRRSNEVYAYHPLALDAEDYLLLCELPYADFSRGGVCFIGSSTMEHSVMTWTLPPQQAAYIHNYAISSATYKEQFQWVRFLVKDRGLASAGPGKMRVILGLSYLDTRAKLPGLMDEFFVPDLFHRHGLYQYDADRGISDIPMSRLRRTIILEKMRDCDFLQQFGGDLMQRVLSHVKRPTFSPPESDQSAADHQMQIMGGFGRWRVTMDYQTGQLSEMIDYLRQHQIEISAVILPLKNWNRLDPFAEAFHQSVVSICTTKEVPLLDVSHDFSDQYFADETHLNYSGQQQLSPQLLTMAQEHLRQIGLLAKRANQ
jgi:hypothetical protein